MQLFTIVGARENGDPLFVHAHASDAEQLEEVAKEVYGEGATIFILNDHCEAADNSDPELLSETAVNLCYNPASIPSAFLRDYCEWLRHPD